MARHEVFLGGVGGGPGAAGGGGGAGPGDGLSLRDSSQSPSASAQLLELSLFPPSQPPIPSPHALLLGLPPSLSTTAFLSFIEPYLSECVEHEVLSSPSWPDARHALLTFRSPRAAQSFVDVYNNQHFPDFPSAPPSLVLLVTLAPSSRGSASGDRGDGERHPGALPLPTCSVCIRRISIQVTQVPGR